MNDYVAPEVDLAGFTCPHCGRASNFSWDFSPRHGNLWYRTGVCMGLDCRESVVFVSRYTVPPSGGYRIEGWTLVWPRVGGGPPPAADMPDPVRQTYEEARAVFHISPRAAGGLLRLAVEELLDELDVEGRSLDDRIGELVARGLPETISKALDAVRVIGNNSIHPGQITEEDRATVEALFRLVNLIVKDRITEPKDIDLVYEILTVGQLEHIEERNARKLLRNPADTEDATPNTSAAADDTASGPEIER